MIEVKRPATSAVLGKLPALLKGREEFKKFFSMDPNRRRQMRAPFIAIPPEQMDILFAELLKHFNSKCAYCETAIPVRKAAFDHFRPKSSAKGLNSEFSLDHYWNLAFDWRNMYLSCQDCNRHKVNWFPVKNERAAPTDGYAQTRNKEHNLLIDPCKDQPAQHLTYLRAGHVRAKSEEGKITIQVLQLNRGALTLARRRKLNDLERTFRFLEREVAAMKKNKDILSQPKYKEAIDKVKQLYDPKSTTEFLGIQRQLFEEWLFKSKSTKDLRKLLEWPAAGYTVAGKPVTKPAAITTARGIKKAALPDAAGSQPFEFLNSRVIINSIEIKNFKSIEHLSLNFPEAPESGASWLMLLGENGVGKSSLLQAVALTLMGEKYRKNLAIAADDILRNGTEIGFVKIHRLSEPPIELHFNKTRVAGNIPEPPSYLLAYGSTRLFPSKKLVPETGSARVKAQNLFDPAVALQADNWLTGIFKTDVEKFDFAARALKDILARELDDPELKFTVVNSEVWLHYSKPSRAAERLRTLSDGYKSIIALACDMISQLLETKSTMEIAEGIVLIDEIGTHLHPRWKMRVVKSLRKAFPRLQFIVTTHDPLCLKGMQKGEIVVFDKDENNRVFAVQKLPDPAEFRAEQLLSSRFFGLHSTIDDELEMEFTEYYSLLARQNSLTDAEKARVEVLKEKLKEKKHLGETLREELALSAADEVLSRNNFSITNASIQELKAETAALLDSMWQDSSLAAKE